MKYVIYYNVLRKYKFSKFEKKHFLEKKIQIKISPEYYNEKCTEEKTTGTKTTRIKNPIIKKFEAEWKKIVSVDKKQKEAIVVSTEVTSQDKSSEESVFQLSNSVYVVVSRSDYFAGSSDFPAVLNQVIYHSQKRLMTKGEDL